MIQLATKGKFITGATTIDVSNNNDIVFYVYDGNYLTTEKLLWKLYKRPNESVNFSEVASGNVENGNIKINLNDYGLQYVDNQYLLKVFLNKNDFVVGESLFWYYYLKYTTAPKRVPWHTGSSYLMYQGGGSMGVAPIYKERPFPTIIIKKFEDEDDKLKDIKIKIDFYDMNL